MLQTQLPKLDLEFGYVCIRVIEEHCKPADLLCVSEVPIAAMISRGLAELLQSRCLLSIQFLTVARSNKDGCLR